MYKEKETGIRNNAEKVIIEAGQIFPEKGINNMENKQKRIIKANKTYCEESEQQEGVEICSWENMPGWNSFLNGEITEPELSDQAKEEMAEFAKTFSKYTVVDKDKKDPASDEEPVRKERAKIANQIYKKACAESGKSLCFFKNFASWQKFVHGEIGDAEFYKMAVEDIRKAVEHLQN
jgi:hypothetical protein